METPSSSLCEGALAAEVLEKYHALWQVAQYRGRNPAPQPVSLEREHFPELLERSYFVSDKSDGVRYVLFLVRALDKDLALMVDRKLCLYQVAVAAGRSYFEGSIFDGELVTLPCGSHLFLIYDVVALRGSAAAGKGALPSRLQTIRAIFDLEGANLSSPEEAEALAKRGKIVCGGSARGLSFLPKQFFQLQQLDTLARMIPTLPYAVDGIIFTPAEEPVRTGTHETLFKLKWKHTIDLEVAAGGDDLLVGVGGSPSTAVLRSSLETLGVGFALHPELQAALPQLAGSIVEVLLSLEEDGATPSLRLVSVRRDKAHPNAGTTVLRTLRNLRENISLDDVISLARRV